VNTSFLCVSKTSSPLGSGIPLSTLSANIYMRDQVWHTYKTTENYNFVYFNLCFLTLDEKTKDSERSDSKHFMNLIRS
jgi:hypothetical protein